MLKTECQQSFSMWLYNREIPQLRAYGCWLCFGTQSYLWDQIKVKVGCPTTDLFWRSERHQLCRAATKPWITSPMWCEPQLRSEIMQQNCWAKMTAIYIQTHISFHLIFYVLTVIVSLSAAKIRDVIQYNAVSCVVLPQRWVSNSATWRRREKLMLRWPRGQIVVCWHLAERLHESLQTVSDFLLIPHNRNTLTCRLMVKHTLED